MKNIRVWLHQHWPTLGALLIVVIFLGVIFTYRLGSLTIGLSSAEGLIANHLFSWHNLYRSPLYLPLELVRTVLFKVIAHPNITLLRLPNVIFGVFSILSLGAVLRFWHGSRAALGGTLLFALSSWTLHVSRYASNDSLYLWALPLLLLSHILLQRYAKRFTAVGFSLISWGLLIYIPGMVWLLLINLWWQRAAIRIALSYSFHWWQRLALGLAAIYWLPILLHSLIQMPSSLRTWLGLPNHFSRLPVLLKDIIAVPVHLFIRGPEYPAIWLGKLPLLDIFSLVCMAVGIYFYARHLRASRSRMLFSFFLISTVLVGLGGPVSLSLIVPLLYCWVAAGLAYLLRAWLQVFPFNPLARGLGIGLLSIAVAVSCLYNLRAYFIAWPYNTTTQATFRVRH